MVELTTEVDSGYPGTTHAVSHVLATVSFAAALGSVFLAAAATAHRVSIAFQYDAWQLVDSVPFGLAQTDFFAASFGILMTIASWAWGRARVQALWIVVACCIVLIFTFMVFMFIMAWGHSRGLTIVLLCMAYTMPLLLWAATARMYQPLCLRNSLAKSLRHRRDRMSLFDRQFERRLRAPVRRYSGFVLIWSSIGIGVCSVMLGRLSMYTITTDHRPVVLTGGQLQQAVWVLRADSAGYFFMTQESEDVGWIRSADVSQVRPAEPLMKTGGKVAKMHEQVEARVLPSVIFTAIMMALGGFTIVAVRRADKVEIQRRMGRRKRSRPANIE